MSTRDIFFSTVNDMPLVVQKSVFSKTGELETPWEDHQTPYRQITSGELYDAIMRCCKFFSFSEKKEVKQNPVSFAPVVFVGRLKYCLLEIAFQAKKKGLVNMTKPLILFWYRERESNPHGIAPARF